MFSYVQAPFIMSNTPDALPVVLLWSLSRLHNHVKKVQISLDCLKIVLQLKLIIITCSCKTTSLVIKCDLYFFGKNIKQK